MEGKCENKGNSSRMRRQIRIEGRRSRKRDDDISSNRGVYRSDRRSSDGKKTVKD